MTICKEQNQYINYNETNEMAKSLDSPQAWDNVNNNNNGAAGFWDVLIHNKAQPQLLSRFSHK